MAALHEELARVVAALPDEKARQLLGYARWLAGPPFADEPELEYGDLTEEDKRAIAADAFRRFDLEHPDEDWGEDFTVYGGPACPPPAT